MKTKLILATLLTLTLSACASTPVPPEVSGHAEYGFSPNSGSYWQEEEERAPASPAESKQTKKTKKFK